MARDGGDLVVDPWDGSAIVRVPDLEPDEVQEWCRVDVVRRVPSPAPRPAADFDN
jgi:hypothetical protein